MTNRWMVCVWLVALASAGLSGCGDDASAEDPQRDSAEDTSGDASTSGATSGADADTQADAQTDAQTDTQADADTTEPPALAPYCVGVRGNGELVFAHFASLARVVEHYGLPQAVAGGSSASISSFILESVALNPAVRVCGGQPCSAAQAGERAGFLLKSLPAYAAYLGATDEGQAFTQLAPVIAQAAEQGLGDLFASGDLTAAKDALLTLLNSPDIADLINPEVLSLIENSPDAAFHAQEMYEALTSFGSFSVTDDRVLIRPGLISFDGLAEKVGRIGSFYAGYGSAEVAAQWDALLSACADGNRGKPWSEVRTYGAGNRATCEDAFFAMLDTWRTDWVANEASYTSRVDDPVGQSLRALISTSILTGDTLVSWSEAKSAYFNAQPYTFTPNFADVRFGYWGREEDLAAIARGDRGYDDEKTRRFLSLGQTTWRVALSLSPAEPGLSRAVVISRTEASAGGWSDLHPVLALKSMGCERVVYVTRRGGESGFAQGVAAMLGADAATLTALYDLSQPTSSFALSLSEADGVWCTDWNAFSGAQILEITEDGSTAPLETDDPAFTGGPTPYPNTTDRAGFAGCTPGVAPTP